MTRVPFALGLVAALGACSAGPMPDAPPGAAPAPRFGETGPAPTDAVGARAQAAMADLSTRLRGELQAAIAEGGFAAAVDFCHDHAPRIADDVGAAHGVSLGRVAVPGRQRNAGNVAEDWLRDAIDAFQSAVDDGAAPEVQHWSSTSGLPEDVALRVAKGIRVEPACLACHGEAIAPEIAASLAARYPRDRATGFREGDLRGAIWVEVPRTESAP